MKNRDICGKSVLALLTAAFVCFLCLCVLEHADEYREFQRICDALYISLNGIFYMDFKITKNLRPVYSDSRDRAEPKNELEFPQNYPCQLYLLYFVIHSPQKIPKI